MADYNPIPLQTTVPDPMKPLSGMLNMASTVQGMQAQRLAMTGQEQQNQSNAITLQERQGMQRVLADPTQWQNQDGSTDYNRLIPAVMKAAPTTGMDYIGKMAQTERQATDAKQTIMNLGTNQRQIVGQYVQSLTGQPADKVNAGLDALTKQYPELAPATSYAKTVFSHLDKNGGQQAIDQGLSRFAQMTLTPTEQQTYNTPNAVSVSNGIQTGLLNTKPGVNGIPQGGFVPGGTQTQLVPLGQQQSVGTDINGNPIVTSKDAHGNIQAPSAMPGSTAAPQINYPAGESQQTKQAREQEVLEADSAFRQGQQVHDINKTVISELDRGIDTGKLGEFNHYLATRTGYNGAGGEDANSYELLQKMLARSAIASAQKMGPNTNAGLEAQGAANGTVAYGPATLKNIAHLNDAIQTGVDNYNHGMHAAIANGGSVFAKTKFDQQWSANANIDALKLSNAIKLGDQKQIDAVITGLGGRNSSKFNAVVKNIQNLSTLTQRGSL